MPRWSTSRRLSTTCCCWPGRTRARSSSSTVPVDLADVAAEAADGAGPLAAERAFALVDPAPAPTIGDPARLRQLVTILVDNAIAPQPGRVRRCGSRRPARRRASDLRSTTRDRASAPRICRTCSTGSGGPRARRAVERASGSPSRAGWLSSTAARSRQQISRRAALASTSASRPTRRHPARRRDPVCPARRAAPPRRRLELQPPASGRRAPVSEHRECSRNGFGCPLPVWQHAECCLVPIRLLSTFPASFSSFSSTGSAWWQEQQPRHPLPSASMKIDRVEAFAIRYPLREPIGTQPTTSPSTS